MTASSIRLLFVLTLCVAAAPALTAQPCMISSRRLPRNGSSQHWNSSDSDRGLSSTTIRWRRGECELRVDARGDFNVRADLSGFTSVDEGGYVQLEERDGDHERRVRITNSGSGLDYRWTLDGGNGFDVDREKWLAGILLAVERRTGMFAKARVPALLRQGGVDAVLEETNQMEGDYARRVYYTLLLTSTKLADPQTERMLRQVGDSMSSDFERSEVLRAVAAQGPMSDRVTRAAIGVAQRMSSDFEKRRSLSAGLESVNSPDARMALFTAASTMSSSFEIAELLIAAQRRSLVDSVSSEAYFKAVSRLSSDFERRRTLSALLKQRPESPALLGGVLKASTSINSDFELASLLVEFAHTVPVRGELRELYLKATRSINSDFEYRRALQALLEQDQRT
jgi:hypothetical protein